MPLWRIYHEASVFTDAQKSALASAITKLYTDIKMPAFYVNVVFIPLPASSIYVGGSPTKKFVRFTIEQIARSFKNDEVKHIWMKKIDEALKPHVKDRGDLSWEYHIVETERMLWKIDGIVPPGTGTLAESRWVRENRGSDYSQEENVREIRSKL
jgi:hypothetical protein